MATNLVKCCIVLCSAGAEAGDATATSAVISPGAEGFGVSVSVAKATT